MDKRLIINFQKREREGRGEEEKKRCCELWGCAAAARRGAGLCAPNRLTPNVPRAALAPVGMGMRWHRNGDGDEMGLGWE